MEWNGMEWNIQAVQSSNLLLLMSLYSALAVEA
jgi:hypothetical protein